MKEYGTEEKFVEVLEIIISIALKWGFNKTMITKVL
jgi:hypothetical protein